jgi:PAS domain S-box-containing protein
MSVLISLIITFISIRAGFAPNFYAMVAFVVLALVSWLSARSLERALEELRAINRELDQRVEERTRDLAAALAREQAEANKNQAILEGIADGVIVFDKEGCSIVANPAISQLIERPAEKIIGYEIKDLMSDRVAGKDQETLINLLQEKESHAPSIRLDWGKKTLSVSVAPVNAADDGVSGTVVVFRDYTREAEVERMKSAFVSMVSHDLRTPLSAITGYTDMLREAVYGPLSEAQLGVMERINSNSGRLLNMVNNLLDQAQIETGKLSLKVNLFNPQDLIAEMEAVMHILAENKGIELVSSIDERLPSTLSGDQQRLHQILVNLVNNAIKFTDEGSVTVRLYRHDDEHWAMDVTDTGPGIPSDAQAYIFESFRRVNSAATRQKSGVGLGLSIVKQLTAAMGGDVKLTSMVGQGSTFTVVMPIVPVQEDIA